MFYKHTYAKLQNGFTRVTHNTHTKSEEVRNGLAAWWRGLTNQLWLRGLLKKGKEGGTFVSSDLRAGGGRRK